MYYEKKDYEGTVDGCNFQSALGMPSTNPMLTVLPCSPRVSRTHRYHPYSHEHPTLYRPQLNIPRKERSPSPPPQTGTHVSNLLPEILGIIFSYLDVRDKGTAARVCSAWRQASYITSVWGNVEAKLHLRGRRPNPILMNSLTRRGIKKVQILSIRKPFREVTQGVGHLTSLSLSGCYNVKDDNFNHAFLLPIPTLLHLDLSLCKHITDKSVLRLVQSCDNLETLELGGCSGITNTALSAISRGLRRLKYLNLRSCWPITDQGIRLISGQTDESPGNVLLERLGLQDCQNLTDAALKYISQGLTNLNSLNLSFCVNISDIGLMYLAKMTSLRDLNLHSCDNVSDSGLAFMAEFSPPITSLDISFCEKVTDRSLQFISQGLFNLKSLSLRACRISDEGVCRLAKALSDLEVLNVGQCDRITDKSLHAAADSFKNLRWVDLYGCPNVTSETVVDICGKLPRCTFNLTLCDAKRS